MISLYIFNLLTFDSCLYGFSIIKSLFYFFIQESSNSSKPTANDTPNGSFVQAAPIKFTHLPHMRTLPKDVFINPAAPGSDRHLQKISGSDCHLRKTGGSDGHLRETGGSDCHLQKTGGSYSHLQETGGSYSHLQEVVDMLKEMQASRRRMSVERERSSEWGLVAMVMDRVLFVVFVLLTTGVSLCILLQHPQYTVSDSPPVNC